MTASRGVAEGKFGSEIPTCTTAATGLLALRSVATL